MEQLRPASNLLTLGGMRRMFVLTAALLFASFCFAAAKPHVVSFGKLMPVKLFLGPSEDRTIDMQVRALFIDSKLKEFTTGDTHDVTDTIFVVRRAFRINDSLPDEPRKAPKWMWQRGGWLMVDRSTGRVTPVVLPEFDPFYSDVAWYRNYAAYCGINDAASKVFAVVFEIGRKKPILRRELGATTNGDTPEAECAKPDWDRKPPHVTFNPKNAQKFTFTLPNRSIDMVQGSEEEHGSDQ
jgi:hypothetical protein